MTGKVDLRLAGGMDHLRIVWQVGETLLENVPFEEDAEGCRYNILLALQEMVTNILRHAHGLEESKPFEVGLEASADGFRMTLSDQGPAFDPLEFQRPEEAMDGDNLTVGGYGIMIATMVMDEMSYERDGDTNTLSMWKSVSGIVGAREEQPATGSEA